MKNPCEECIVTVMCRVVCYKMTAYLLDSIMSFKPKGSPQPTIYFLEYQCGQMRIYPNRNRNVKLYFSNNDKDTTHCIVEVVDGSIKLIRKADLDEY